MRYVSRMRLRFIVAVVAGAATVACGGTTDSGLKGGASSSNAGAMGAGGTMGAGGELLGDGGSPESGGTLGSGGSGVGGLPPNFHCSANADCAAFGLPFCVSAVGQCAECVENANCPGGATCRTGSCQALIPCNGNAECGAAPGGRTVCEPTSGDCVECITSTDCLGGGTCASNRCIGGIPPGAGGAGFGGGLGAGGETVFGAGGAGFGDGGALGAGGEVVVGAGGTPGTWPGIPEGAWARCQSDSDCADGRTCTRAVQSVIASGRDGGCVKSCNAISTSNCDPGPPGAVVGCASILVGICNLLCDGNSCPDGMECISGYCFWNN